ncbi:hypothetical protein BT96DRAFT_644172 [Gymnopus androsaceus JB14]|uniref:DUF6534 domain-containing protein n=1 Tax=Gymnopus androsaceus JB14 TaxID=1447944 RepID=A0A6A4GH57_9AGAR|nr:hypothetical protein BT96DRAFT_644172 [Gymnopus androsaceus JB14]
MSRNSTAILPALPPSNVIAAAAGPLFVALAVTWLFMGIITMQFYSYYQNYPNDKTLLKYFVSALFIVEVFHWILVTMDAWYYLVEIWGNFEGFFDLPWVAPVIVLLTGIVSFSVQIFYVYRIWMLGHTKIIRTVAITISLISLTQCISAGTASGLTLKGGTEADVANLHIEFQLWLIGSFAADTLIALCMIWILINARRQVAFTRTENILNKIMLNVIKTGTMTSIIAAITLALFVKFPHVNYYGAPANFLEKLYTISLLANLNSRNAIRNESQLNESYQLSIHIAQQSPMTTMDEPIERRNNQKATEPEWAWDQSLQTSGEGSQATPYA